MDVKNATDFRGDIPLVEVILSTCAHFALAGFVCQLFFNDNYK